MISFKSIRPAHKFKSSVFREKLRARADAYGNDIKSDFEKTTATWKPADKPTFTKTVKVGASAGGALAKKANGSATGVSVEVSTDSEIYGYVDTGTKVRYATMTKGFQPKTKVNKIASYRGRGGVAFINKKQPRPGIRARNFSKIIHKKHQPLFRKDMQDALNEAARASGHGA